MYSSTMRALTRRLYLLTALLALCSAGYAQTSPQKIRNDLGEALAAFINGDYEHVFDRVAPLADIGLAEAQHLLAQVHLKTQFAGYDTHEAFRLMRLSAAQGLPIAQHDLGEMYRHGIGVEPDPLAAFSWHLRAARQRLRPSERKLSQMYAAGEGVQRDADQAAKWAARAARKDRPSPPQRMVSLPSTSGAQPIGPAAGQRLSVRGPNTQAPDIREPDTRSPQPQRSEQRPIGYKVQLGAYQRAGVAEAARQRIAAALPERSVQRLNLAVTSGDKGDGKGLLHRIQAGPMSDLAAARFICDQIHSRLPEQGCFTITLYAAQE
ncbi:MAG: hypothetical protein GKR94_23080 [Gammaproteobacteria bacterium]|nr:hypothetical protein [Gammaproteobacteria bacterium]